MLNSLSSQLGLATSPIYRAQVDYCQDKQDGHDKYKVRWYKNGIPLTLGVTNATIYVTKTAEDGTVSVLVTDDTAMTEEKLSDVGTGCFVFWADNTAGKLQLFTGWQAEAKVTAMIDGSTRTDFRPVSHGA
jgi:hypothetical protein